MAIIKAITYPDGVTVSYWKIKAKRFENYVNTAEIMVSGYKDKALRLTEGSEEAKTITVLINGDDYTPDMSRAQLYAAMKNTPQFEGATDDV